MYSSIAANKRKTLIIMVLFVLVIGALGWLFSQMFADGNPTITYGVLVGSAIYAFFSYISASKMTLALNGAQKIEKRDNPRVCRIVENLTITEGLPMPKVYIMEDPAANAFATGRNPDNASVCVTTGILNVLTDTELEGVLAHEMGHIKNYDIRVNIAAFAMVAVIGMLADLMLHMTWFSDSDDDSNAMFLLGIVGALLAPLVAALIQMAISRQREYLADATGALTTRHPEGLISALEKIEQAGSATKRQNASTAHLFFANPLKGKSLNSLFSTHPPTEERILRLREMGKKA